MILRDYQNRIASEASQLLDIYGIAYLSMQVRTGKTATALEAARLFLETEKAPLVLFITKKKAISSIHDDAAALQVPYDLIVINYEQITNLDTLVKSNAHLFIIDEAHSLGAFPKPSERTKQLKEIIGAKPVIFLSGTPSPESDSQLYHQFYVSDFSPWSKYRNFYAWAKEYVNVKQKYLGHGTVNDYSYGRRDKIMNDCQHLFLSYTQEEAGFTQLVDEEIIEVEMKTSTYTFANSLKNKRVLQNKDGDVVLADTNVRLLNKLHQIYSGSVIIDEPKRTGSVFDLTKAEYIKKRFEGQKIAIFYKFISELTMLRTVFGYRLVETPEAFRDGGPEVVFVSQIQSGREGINLSTGDALIMLNIDFSAVSYFQARARMQTKDRDKAVKIYWIFSKNGIESKIYERVKNKQDYTLQYFKKDFKL